MYLISALSAKKLGRGNDVVIRVRKVVEGNASYKSNDLANLFVHLHISAKSLVKHRFNLCVCVCVCVDLIPVRSLDQMTRNGNSVVFVCWILFLLHKKKK